MKNAYTSFDAYVADFPEGERFRAWLTNLHLPRGTKGAKSHKAKLAARVPTREPLILKTTEHESCPLPGGYVWASTYEWEGQHYVTVHDSDDFMVKKIVSDPQAELNELIALVPFSLQDIVAVLGYKFD